MALTQTRTIESNLTGNVSISCYIKIAKITATKETATADVCFTKETSEGPIVYTQVHTYPVSLNGDNFIKQGYLYLKSLDEFSDAGDV